MFVTLLTHCHNNHMFFKNVFLDFKLHPWFWWETAFEKMHVIASCSLIAFLFFDKWLLVGTFSYILS